MLALRRLHGNWRLLTSVVVGTVVAGAMLASTAIYADAIRDLGLSFALDQPAPETLDVRVSRTSIAIRGELYAESRARIDAAVGGVLGPARGGVIRQVTTATFYPSGPGAEPDLDDAARPRANLVARTELADHVRLEAGRLPQVAAAGDPQIEVAIGVETARRNAIAVGDRLDLHPFWDEEAAPIGVAVVGLVSALDAGERYWGGDAEAVDAQTASWPTYLLFVPEPSLFEAVTARLPSTTARLLDIYEVVPDGLNSRRSAAIADGLFGLEARLAATEAGPRVASDLEEVLRSFDDKLFFVRIPLFVLMLQIGGVVGYYLLMVSTMLVEREASEIATLRSRGATRAQLLAEYGIEAAVLATLAVLAGPPLAALVISALGPTPAFSDLSGGEPLDVHLSRMSFALAGAGALVAFLAFMVPAWQATRATVIGFKREAARPRRAPLFLRLYLDVALVVVLAVVFWRLRAQDELFEEPLFGDPQADPFLLATPAVAMLTAGVVFLRLFPLGLRLAARLVAHSRAAAPLVGARALARNPTHFSRLILMLMLATGVGMFGATFSATLDRSFDDRARYAVGADVRASDLRALSGEGEAAFFEALAQVPATVASPVVRAVGAVRTLDGGAEDERVTVLGVDPGSFGEVAYFREDFAGQSLESMLATLEANTALSEYVALPRDARQLGVWLQLADIRAGMDVLAVIADARGRIVTPLLGEARPGDAVTSAWRFFATDLVNVRSSRGRPVDVELTPPLTLRAVLVRTGSAIGAQRGVVLFGPVLTSPLPPVGLQPRRAPEPATEAFAGASVAHDFTAGGFELLEGTSTGALADRLRTVADAPPGFASALRYEWLDSGFAPQVRGLRQRTDGAETLFFLSQGAATRLGLREGDAATLSADGARLRGRLAGTFELFPTYDSNDERQGLAVVSASRLIVDGNAALPFHAIRHTEMWLASGEPAVTAAALVALRPQELLDVEGERLRQEEDPLIAAGWEGILAISFAAVLLLSAIGFLIYSYLTAQQRRLEFAVLRTLGFSRRQVFGVVLLEQLFVVVAGMGLGTVVGLQVGRLMMDFFSLDEQGAQVLPPFVLSVSGMEVGLVWGILGAVFVATLGAVALLYVRLALHRALRVGEG